MTRAQALIALEAAGGDERLVAAVERSDFVLTPALAAVVEDVIDASHIRIGYYPPYGASSHGRTRGQVPKYGWEA